MNKNCRNFIKKTYLNDCAERNKQLTNILDLTECENRINWFFNRLDFFETYVNRLTKYIIPEGIHRERVYYACNNSGMDYNYICGIINTFEYDNKQKVTEYEL